MSSMLPSVTRLLIAAVLVSPGSSIPQVIAAPARPSQSAPAPNAGPVLRRQTVAPLPGGLDPVLLVNDNNPVR